jgi:hypothetical protein
MGLNAVVYRNAARLAADYGGEKVDCDPQTGEALLSQTKKWGVPEDAIVACKQRLGNVAETLFLREEVEKVLDHMDSLLLRRVLYSASHSGDIIEAGDFPRLIEEIGLLKNHGEARLIAFIEAMESLLLAAKAENNPIVFV